MSDKNEYKNKEMNIINSSNIVSLWFGKKDKNTNQPKQTKHHFEQNLREWKIKK